MRPENQKIQIPEAPTQQDIDSTISRYLSNTQKYLRTNETNPDAARVITANQVIVAGEEVIDENPIMLASVSKFAFDLVLAEQLFESKVDEFTVDANVVAELAGRSPQHLIDSSQFYFEVVNDPEVSGLVRLYMESDPDAKEHGELDRELKKLIRSRFAGTTFTISRQELAYNVLTISSNSATTFVKEYLSAIGSEAENLDSVLPQWVPSFHRTISLQNMHHWVQPDPNVGLLSEFVELMNLKAREYSLGEISEVEKVTLDAMINNGTDFGFCFTHSELGQELIRNGWKVVEKTGYYPCVFWVQVLAESPNDLPMHMVHATVFSLIPPQGSNQEVITFGHSILTAVASPKVNQEIKLVTADGGEYAVVAPDEWEETYAQMYSKPIKKRVNQLFRKEIQDAVRTRLDG